MDPLKGSSRKGEPRPGGSRELGPEGNGGAGELGPVGSRGTGEQGPGAWGEWGSRATMAGAWGDLLDLQADLPLLELPLPCIMAGITSQQPCTLRQAHSSWHRASTY